MANKYIIFSGFLIVLITLFLQVQGDLLTSETQQAYESSIEQPEILKNIKNGTLVRRKRQTGNSYCPSRPSSGYDKGKSSIILYSPIKREDIALSYAGTKWRTNDIEALESHGFNASQPTLIYMHAYSQSSRSGWLLGIRDSYDKMFPRSSEDKPQLFNLMFFDWSDYSRLQYKVAASFVPYLGKVLSEFLQKLAINYSYDMNRLHIVSYSLSTHISGNAGRQMPFENRIGKITALDPTGVCFHEDVPYAKEYALRPTDANFVVARHYDIGGLGSRRLIGGLDVFVNGGNNQPGIYFQPGSLFQSHTRAATHEAQQRRDGCQEVAYKCRSFDSFLKGECGSCGSKKDKCYFINTFEETLMNEKYGSTIQPPSNYRPRTKMFIKTGTKTFCLHHYQLLVRMKDPISSTNKKLLKAGFVTFDLGFGLKATPRHQLKGNPQKFTALITQSKKIEQPEQVKVLVESENESDGFISALDSVELNYMSRALAEDRAAGSAKYCPDSESSKNKLNKC